MSLFGSLPPPTAKRAAEEAAAEEQEQEVKRLRASDAQQAPQPPPAEQQQQQEEGEQAAAETGEQPPGTAGPPPHTSGGQDQVAAALRKIASHISHPKKFPKASELLRQLFGQGALRAEHGPLAFSALKAAMRDPQRAHDPQLAREYSKLFTVASKHAELFTLRERSQLDVYGTWAVLRNQLTTDDSFQFNKVVARLKEMAEALPEASEADDEVLQRLQERAEDPDPILAEPSAGAAAAAAAAEEEAGAAAAAGAEAGPPPPPPVEEPAAPAAAAAAAAPAAPSEADPFGLDALLEAPAPPPPPPPPAPPAHKPPARRKSVTWSGEEMTNQRRVALLDCVDTCKACYRNAWARTSVDLLIEHLHKHADRFAPSQRARLAALMVFVRDQRRIRKLGPSAKEAVRDTTSFEAARAEWSKQAVSARGKVGSAGDHKTEMWLG